MSDTSLRISRRDALWQLAGTVTAAFAAPAFGGQSIPARRTRPNILLVLMDDMRWDFLHHAGHPFIRTPNLDRLAREGARFTNAFVCLSLCSPSRASFLTGVYAHLHGVLDNRTPLDIERTPSFPLLLQRAGYRTAMFGKWHMGVDDEPKPGFDHWACFRGQGRYFDPELNINGARRTFEGFTDDVTTRLTVDWMRAERDPFAAVLGFKSCHSGFEPPPRAALLYADTPIPKPATFDRAAPDQPLWIQRFDDAGHTPYSRIPYEELVRRIARLVTTADENVGVLLAALDESGQLDRTMVVFSSDNGFLLHEHGLYDKRAMYEESIRIPLIVRYPPIVKGRRRLTALALNIDVAPTLLDLAGAGGSERMHGMSLLPLLAGRRQRTRPVFFYQYDRERPYSTPSLAGVRDERWKLVKYREPEQAHELYDLKRDPHEARNRFTDPPAAAQRLRLERELDRLEALVRLAAPIDPGR